MAYTSRDMRRFNHLLQETDAVYHEMAQHWGLPDSVMGVLYTLCDAGGRCRLRDICYWSGMTKQTVNSALRRMEREGLIYLEAAGRGKDVCLTEAGEGLACRTALRVIQAENQVFAAWPQADVEQYLALTRQFKFLELCVYMRGELSSPPVTWKLLSSSGPLGSIFSTMA